jgi:alpha-beta hydrolase superfamily lysophospholipase
MKAEPFDIRGERSASATREPLYFKSGDRSLFGWLHTPGTGAGDVGLVVCKAFGYEAICSHRSVRVLVDAAVSLGIPTLRFDYLGTGDSEDIEPGADQLQAWVAEVAAAVAELKRRTGVSRVCLLGLRLGALIATLAAAQCAQVSALALIAPIVDGRRFIRDLKMTQLAASLAAKAARGPGSPAPEPRAAAGSLEAGGYALSPATVASLSAADLNTLTAPPAAQLLVIDRDDLPSARAWSDQLSELGAEVHYESLPGYIGMLMSAPQYAVTPDRVVAAVRGWLERFRPVGAPASVPAGADTAKRPIPETAVLRIPTELSDASACVTERPVWLGSDSALFGILTEPRAGETRRRGVIFINAGADNHTGASRLHVSLAREWALRGYVALRLDLGGLGDSDTRPGRPDDEVFPPAALDDIRAAVEFVRSRYGVGEVTLGGICSGGYHALRAAVCNLPVNRILLVNAQNFFWNYNTTLQDVQLADVVRGPEVHRERVRSVRAWRRVFAGEVDLTRFVKIYFHRALLSLETLLRDAARSLNIKLPRDLGWLLHELDARSVRIVMVFSRGEPGLELLRIHGGLSTKGLQNRCRIHVIDGADHTFTRSGPRAILKDLLSDELFAPPGSQPASTGVWGGSQGRSCAAVDAGGDGIFHH